MKVEQMDRGHKALVFVARITGLLIQGEFLTTLSCDTLSCDTLRCDSTTTPKHLAREQGVTPKGIALFDQIEREGFRPTKLEISRSVKMLMPACRSDTKALVSITCSNWDGLKESVYGEIEKAVEDD